MEIISQEEKYTSIADAIVLRTYEVYHYNTNIENYTKIIATLPIEWPEHLARLRGLDPHQAVAECSLEDVDLLSDLQQLDRLQYLLRTEKLECNKAKKMLEVEIGRLPDSIRDAEIAKAITRYQDRLRAV
jgi:hypothetical protein